MCVIFLLYWLSLFLHSPFFSPSLFSRSFHPTYTPPCPSSPLSFRGLWRAQCCPVALRVPTAWALFCGLSVDCSLASWSGLWLIWPTGAPEDDGEETRRGSCLRVLRCSHIERAALEYWDGPKEQSRRKEGAALEYWDAPREERRQAEGSCSERRGEMKQPPATQQAAFCLADKENMFKWNMEIRYPLLVIIWN